MAIKLTRANSNVIYKPRFQIRSERLLIYLILFSGAFIMLFPVFWMTVSVFKSEMEISKYPPTLLPAYPTLDVLKKTWTSINLGLYFINSVLLSAVIVPLSTLTSAWVGFVLAKYSFRGKNLMFAAILGTLLIPGTVTFVPRYQVVVWFGLLNNYMAVILPSVYTAFGIFLMRQSMHGIPNELLDAARIDGANEPRIFVQIILPMLRTPVATLLILQFRTVWTELLWPMLVLTREKLFTLPMGLAALSAVGNYEPNFATRNVGAFISVIPMIIIFLIFERHITLSFSLSGLKS